MDETPLDALIDEVVASLGFELVEVQRAGHRSRPILRVSIDRPDSVPGPGQPGVSLDDCAAVSRALEARLDAREDVAERYVLEVSSPGVERPLVRPRDYARFAGFEAALRGKGPLAGRARRLEGTLLGLDGPDDAPAARLRLAGGEEVTVPLAEVDRAHLTYRWDRPRPGAPDRR